MIDDIAEKAGCQVIRTPVGEANVAAARGNVESAGLYGPVSIAHIAGARLPYADPDKGI